MFHSQFFKDKTALLMSLILSLLSFFNILFVLLSTDTSQSSTPLKFWSVLGIPEVDKQTPEQLYSFAIFAVLTLVISLVLSFKLHDVYKPSAYAVLALAMFVILTNTIVSGAILSLQQ